MKPSPDRRVLHIIHGLTVGGAEMDLVNKSIALVRRYGYHVTICCLMRAGELASRAQAAGVGVIGPLMRHRYDALAGRQLRRLLLAEPWSLVHAHLFAANVITAATLMTLAPTRRPPFIAAEHAMAERWGRWTFVYRWLQRSAALILVPSQASAASYVAHGIGGDRIKVVPNGIDVQGFDRVDRASARVRIRRRLHIPPDAHLVGTVCRLQAVKGLPVLLKAVERMPVHLVIAGDGPERAYLASLIQARRLGDRVQLLGSCLEVPDLLAALDVFALPSTSESFGVAVAESLLVGTPVVATDVGGIPEVTGGGRYARLVPPGDPTALAQGIQWMIDHPEEAQVQAGQGRAFVRRAFSLEIVVEQQRATYDRLLAHGNCKHVQGNVG